jgi:hypothetical protein
MAAEAARSGRVRTERKALLSPNGLLMEGDCTHNPDYFPRTHARPIEGNHRVSPHSWRKRLAGMRELRADSGLRATISASGKAGLAIYARVRSIPQAL